MFYIPSKSLTAEDMKLIEAFRAETSYPAGLAWKAYMADMQRSSELIANACELDSTPGEFESIDDANRYIEYLACSATKLCAYEGTSVVELITSPDDPPFSELKVKKCVNKPDGSTGVKYEVITAQHPDERMIK